MKNAEIYLPATSLIIWVLLCVFNVGPFQVISYDPTNIVCLVNLNSWSSFFILPIIAAITFMFGATLSEA